MEEKIEEIFYKYIDNLVDEVDKEGIISIDKNDVTFGDKIKELILSIAQENKNNILVKDIESILKTKNKATDLIEVDHGVDIPITIIDDIFSKLSAKIELDKNLKEKVIFKSFYEYNFGDERSYTKRIDFLFNYIKEKSNRCLNRQEKYLYDKTKIIFITTINTLLEKLDEIKKVDKNKSDYIFRGHSNFKWELSPSIYRHKQWIINEDKMFRETILKNPKDFIDLKSTFEKLVKMQHYGLPTRLLDITNNPLIALYFACMDSDSLKIAGELIILKEKKDNFKYYDSDTVSLIANISKMKFDFIDSLIFKSRKFNEIETIKKLIHEIREEKPYFEPKILKDDLKKTIFVKPKMENERILRQDGLFLLFGVENTKIEKSKLNELIFDYKRFIILHKDKKTILKELDDLNINSSSLFPELMNSTKYIADKFKNI